MQAPYLFLGDLAGQVDIPADGILSRTLYSDDHVKVVLFGFGAGQELSEHTASRPATLWFVEGEAELTLGGETRAAKAGSWVYMTPNLSHSVKAQTPLIMLLVLS